MAEKLPREIMFDIFLRLDIESLLRARLACEAWRLMMDDPCFARMHLASTANSPTSPLLISWPNSIPKSHTAVFCTLKEEEDGHRCTLKTSFVAEVLMKKVVRNFILGGSCNGLLCIESSRDNVLICNPLLKQVITLPTPTLKSLYQYFAIGYDSKSNTYKIVHVTYEDLVRGQHPFRERDGVEVYTLGTNSWRKISEKPKYPQYGRPVFAHGSLHWITNDHINHTDVIQSFDLEKEEFYVTACPDFKHKYLIEYYGDLAIVDISSNMYIEIWAWKRNCDGAKKWTKEYRIDMKAREGELYNEGVIVTGIWENGKIVLKSNNGLFLTYNPKNDDFRCVYIPGITTDTTSYCIGFRGSLVSLSPYKFVQ